MRHWVASCRSHKEAGYRHSHRREIPNMVVIARVRFAGDYSYLQAIAPAI
ncbi:MAG: hypothetical protein ACYTXT_32800 [Nostoc sp.]